MLHKHYKEGEELDVAGLNKIIVLVDRSETEIIEIGHNEWRPRLDGPPHKHGDKDQVFYITSGVGKIKLGDKEFDAKEGCCAYVPHGLVHQTITTGDEPLCYLLLNIFNTPDNKEGHGTFAEHIEKVKQIRKQQAESGSANIVDKESDVSDVKKAKYFSDIFDNKAFENDAPSEIVLLNRVETNGFELTVIKGRSDNNIHSDKEHSIFILHGKGSISVENETKDVKEGEIIFVPRNNTFSCEPLDDEFTYLKLSCVIK